MSIAHTSQDKRLLLSPFAPADDLARWPRERQKDVTAMSEATYSEANCRDHYAVLGDLHAVGPR